MLTRHAHTCLAPAMLLAACALAMPAQAQTLDGVYGRYISSVDPGVSDISPLGASLVQNQPDLRQVRTFDAIFRVPGQPGLLMRQSGALSAVFPRSEYAATQGGLVPIIPAGTVFYIGGIEPNAPPLPPSPSLRRQLARRSVSQPLAHYATLSLTSAVDPSPDPTPLRNTTRADRSDRLIQRSITISSERYRRARLRSISRLLATD